MSDQEAVTRPSGAAGALYVLVNLLFWFGLVLGGFATAMELFSYATAANHTIGTTSAVPEHVIEFLLSVFVLWILRGLAGSVRSGSPFTRPNVRRLRVLALAALVGFPAARLVGVAVRAFSTSGMGWTWFLSVLFGQVIEGLTAGLTLLVLAEVFAYGVRLREEVETTI